MKSLIVGMGIGQLYRSVLTDLGAEVITVDINSCHNPDYTNLESAINAHKKFDTAHICTPNYLHYNHCMQLNGKARVIFVEKPGFASANNYKNALSTLNSRLMMVKNNQWRTNISDMCRLAANSNDISFNWINNNRVPSPGSWFTDYRLSFGGVSRDLLPHLLSLFIRIEPNYSNSELLHNKIYQRWQLKDFTSTDYGTVNLQGTYNVDDRVELKLKHQEKNYKFIADWRNPEQQDDIAIYFDKERIALGLCPEEAYKNMISHVLFNVDNDAFWQDQNRQDLWIHNIIDKLCK